MQVLDAKFMVQELNGTILFSFCEDQFIRCIKIERMGGHWKNTLAPLATVLNIHQFLQITNCQIQQLERRGDEHCTGTVTCSTAEDSRCDQCENGYGFADDNMIRYVISKIV